MNKIDEKKFRLFETLTGIISIEIIAYTELESIIINDGQL